MQCVPLVKDENYQSSYLRLVEYRGCVLNKDSVTSGTMDKIRKFKVRPTDVFVSSFPKSGTTWLQEVVYMWTKYSDASYPNENFSFKWETPTCPHPASIAPLFLEEKRGTNRTFSFEYKVWIGHYRVFKNVDNDVPPRRHIFHFASHKHGSAEPECCRLLFKRDAFQTVQVASHINITIGNQKGRLSIVHCIRVFRKQSTSMFTTTFKCLLCQLNCTTCWKTYSYP